jgi:hypothetical protein
LSVFSQYSSGVATWTRKKFPPAPPAERMISRAAARECAYGAVGAAMTAAPARVSSAETNAIRCDIIN